MTAADFAYGNTRVRARLPDLLSRSDLERLLTLDDDALLGELARTPYAPEVQAEAARIRLPRSLQRAITRHLARTLLELRSFYEGAARETIDLLLRRWDLHNLLVVVRTQASGLGERTRRPRSSRSAGSTSRPPPSWPDSLAGGGGGSSGGLAAAVARARRDARPRVGRV